MVSNLLGDAFIIIRYYSKNISNMKFVTKCGAHGLDIAKEDEEIT